MNAKPLALAVAVSMLFAARAGAQDPDPSTESEGTEEAPPSVEAPPAEAPVETPPEAPPPAPNPDAGFGSARQIAISDDLQLFLTRTSNEGRTGHLTEFRLRPAVDYFAVPNVSVGGQVVIGYKSDDRSENDSAVELGLLFRLGYNLPFSPTVSLWPRVAIGYRHVSGALSPGSSNSSIDAVPFQIYVPVVVQLAAHFFIGGGPILATELYHEGVGVYATGLVDPKATTIGLLSTVGGYFPGF